jgi:two-component system response regulator HydG
VSARVLVLDDDRDMCEMLAAALAREQYAVDWRTAAVDGLALLESEDFDVVVTDLNLGGMSGLELCERVVTNRADIPVVVITAFGSLETAVAAIRAGAYDFITKPFAVEMLALTLGRAVRHRALREEVKRLRRVVAHSRTFGDLLATSPAMQAVALLLERVAASEASVLVTGETGTGKELAARALHERGRRRDGPFVAVNCAALPESLLESELFGHARGAFTDARGTRAGLFLQATGGTLFLDEIADLPLGLQPKLLRALQERTVRAVGSDAEVPFDVRLVAATNRDLESLVEERRFREDLYYRINVVHVPLPALRARGNDVLALAHHFIERYAAAAEKRVTGITAAAAERLLAYSWPGNVRELQNCVERALALTQYDSLTVEDLPQKIRDFRRSHVLIGSDDPEELVPMEEVERRYVSRVMEAVAGNKTLAARILGFDRKTLYRKLEHYAALAGDEQI